MSNSKLIELSYYDPSAQVRLSAYDRHTALVPKEPYHFHRRAL